MESPTINVTPLIDIVVVLLIVFMVVAPIKPSAFKVKLPSDANHATDAPAQTLVVSVNKDYSIDLNGEKKLATVDDTSGLVTRLREVFELREGSADTSLPSNLEVERTVFIRGRRSLDYGSVAGVVDAVKTAGAFPISLQIDHLD